MAKRTKSGETGSNREAALVTRAEGRTENVENRPLQRAVGSTQGVGRGVIEAADRAAAAIPDSVRAENDERERIAARAYELYLQRGGGHGRDTDDWLEAEREVGHRSDRPNDE
jgi:hypothetical protein